MCIRERIWGCQAGLDLAGRFDRGLGVRTVSHTPASRKGWGVGWAGKAGASRWDGRSGAYTGGLATATSQEGAVGDVPSVAGADTRKDVNEGILQLLQKHHEEVKDRLNKLETKVEKLVENSDSGSTHGKGSCHGKGSDADSVGKGSCADSDKSRSSTPRADIDLSAYIIGGEEPMP